ncbi:MAG: dTDP-glucose 4,6-dehydratase [Clostridia bacterium]|nr:dTDP-glucose 4,6-dehydratase [Clostridia bacterium]
MTLLVTGGAGFIGSHFLRVMRESYPTLRLVCLDKLTYAGRREAIEPLFADSRFRFVKGDICDSETVFSLFDEERPDAVVHFAAESHVDRSIEDPALFLRTNVLGTGVLLDAARAFGVRRFHQVSTDEVYGDLPLQGKVSPFTESAPLRPSSPYAASKASADLLALSYFRTYGLPVTVSRCSNNYGPWQYPEKLIPTAIAHALRNEPVPLYGSGENVRDWLWVEDHCRAIDLILQKGRVGETYNIGAGCERSNRALVGEILSLLGRSRDAILHVPDRRGHDLRYALNADKLMRETGWRPQVPFAQGLAETVEWYRRHPEHLRALRGGKHLDVSEAGGLRG